MRPADHVAGEDEGCCMCEIRTTGGAKKFQPGDEVGVDLSEHGWGAFAEWLCVSEGALRPKPASLFALATVRVESRAVTCAGKPSLILEYVEQNVDTWATEKTEDPCCSSCLLNR